MNQKQSLKKITALDRRILNRLQKNIPFVKSPWKSMAKELGIEEDCLLKRIDFLKKNNIIRRVSATFDPRKIGFISTLVAAKIDPKNIDKAAQKLSSYSEVTHNYKRNSEYNLWFTLVAKSRNRISTVLKEIRKDKNIDEALELPATRLFKIGVSFKV